MLFMNTFGRMYGMRSVWDKNEIKNFCAGGVIYVFLFKR